LSKDKEKVSEGQKTTTKERGRKRRGEVTGRVQPQRNH